MFVYVKAWSLCAVVNKMQMWWILVPELLQITNNMVFQATKLTSPNKAKKKTPLLGDCLTRMQVFLLVQGEFICSIYL